MISSKKEQLLLIIHDYHTQRGQDVVKGILLETALKCNYKKVHEIATFWEAKGVLSSRSERGGNLEYMLTSLGYLEVTEILKERKVKNYVLMGIIVFFVIIFVLFKTKYMLFV
ncbi:hypothetical protein DID76_00620 [Candidatus Marinamargulisbacteria bacterium SCGC AG-414-C22]|nr:hypothetical protein DID76_00620 [Candidatus Marinamargulisbacteria bacterium SCGC AG-414-C22]